MAKKVPKFTLISEDIKAIHDAVDGLTEGCRSLNLDTVDALICQIDRLVGQVRGKIGSVCAMLGK